MAPVLDFAHALAGNLAAVRAMDARQGEFLRADPELTSLVQDCRGEIARTWELFRALEVASSCSACAQVRPGGCCFPEVALNHSREQLLANLLLGAELPRSQEITGSCFFVGGRGCKLLLRDSFCVNYFCPALHQRLGQEAIGRLLSQVEREILAGQALAAALESWLKARGLEL